MKRVMETPYIYRDYRLFMSHDFWARLTSNPSYSLRAYARDLSLSPAYLSYLLKKKKHLSVRTAGQVFARLAMTPDEISYLECLVVFETSKSRSEKLKALELIESLYRGARYDDRPEKNLYLRSLEHFLSYGLARSNLKKQDLIARLVGLRLDHDQIVKALEELIAAGYLHLSADESLMVSSLTDRISKDQKIIPIIATFAEFLAAQLRRFNAIQVPTRVAHALVLKFDEPSLQSAVAAHKHFIQQLHRLSESVRTPNMHVLFSDFFWTIESADSEPMPADP